MFGSHLSIAGNMCNALREAESLGMDTVQVFTKNQQQWKAKPLDPGVIAEWRAEMARLGWEGRTVSHASYLINLASVSEDLWRKSIDLMVDEVERCEALMIPFLVHHPGSHVGWPAGEGPACGAGAGMRRIAAAYKEVFERTKGYRTVSCLEGTVGSGCLLGGAVEELAELRRLIAEETGAEGRVGFCLDTCHMHAAGYDLSTRAAAEAALAEFDAMCGLAHVKAVHVNDSKGACGSKRDLHQHIGHGTVGGGPRKVKQSGFAAVVNHPAFRDVPKILETPKGKDAKGRAWDAVNLAVLRGLVDKEKKGAARQPKAGVR